MNGGYPSGSSAARAAAGVRGFQQGAGALAAFLEGARAARLLGRFIPFFGSALLAAEAAYLLWQYYNSRGFVGYGKVTACPENPVNTYALNAPAEGCHEWIVAAGQPASAIGTNDDAVIAGFWRTPHPAFPLDGDGWRYHATYQRQAGAAVPFGRPVVYPLAVAIPVAPSRLWDRPRALAPPIPWPRSFPVAVPLAAGIEMDRRGLSIPAVIPIATPMHPPPGTIEIKVRAQPVVNQLMRRFNEITEAEDLADALHKALPPCFKSRTQKMVRQRKAAQRDGGWNKKYRAADIGSAAKVNDVKNFLRAIAADPTVPSSKVCGSSVSDGGGTITPNAGGTWRNRVTGTDDPAIVEYLMRAGGHAATEEFKDFVYGRMSRDLASLNRDMGNPIGVQSMKRIVDTLTQSLQR